MTLKDTLTQIVSSVMPTNAEIRVNPQTAYYQAGISWKLNNDPQRQYKESKVIILNVSYEVLQDIPNLSGAEQQNVLNRINLFLKEKLKNFDPDHSEPLGVPAPTVIWEINSVVAGLLN